MGWEFAALLIGALVLTGLLSLWQTKRYTNEVNRLAREFNGPGRALVSGRAKGRLRGAIAVLVVDTAKAEVIEAKTMTGVSVFAHLRPAPRLIGPIRGLMERINDSAVEGAVADALERLPKSRAASYLRSATSTPRVVRGATQAKVRRKQ